MTTELGKRIVARRMILGLKQQDVARSTGLSVSYVSMIERGERMPHVKTLERVARALQTTVSALLATSDVIPIAPGGIESLVSYLLARNTSDADVRRVEAIARVLLEAA